MTHQYLGEYRNMPADDYHAIDAIGSTGLRLLSRSAWHYAHRLPVTPTKAMLGGTLVHCAQLEPEALAQRYVVVPKDAPRKPTDKQWSAKKSNEDSMIAKAWWSDFAAANAGKIFITADEFATTQAQLAAINACPELAELFGTGYSETSVFWIDQATGAYCKARPDWVHGHDDGSVTLVDLKATADESPRGFARTVATMGYHRQQAHYTQGYQVATGRRVRRFVFATVSSTPPVLAVPYALDAETVAQGQDECAELLNLLATCQRTDTWPSYGAGLQTIGLPAWARQSQEVEIEYS
jgi:hypothetical protein